MEEYEVVSEMQSSILGLPIGAIYEIEEITIEYACGRIDIRGLPEEDYWSGWHEYSVEPMIKRDWAYFGKFLRSFKSEQLVPYDTLIKLFEAEYGQEIQWDDSED